jgi:hypothetical protein
MKLLVAPSVDAYTDVTCSECKATLDQPCIGYKQKNRVHKARKDLVHQIWLRMHNELSNKLTELTLI